MDKKLYFLPEFEKELNKLKKHSKKLYIKTLEIIESLSKSDEYPIYKVERLRGKYENFYSLRLDHRLRMLYFLLNDEITFVDIVSPEDL